MPFDSQSQQGTPPDKNSREEFSIFSEEIVLRPTQESDAAELVKLYSDQSYQQFLGGWRTTEQTRGSIRSGMTDQFAWGYGRFVIRRRSDESFLGEVGIQHADEAGEPDSVTIATLSTERRKGIGREALTLLLRHYAKYIEKPKIFAFVKESNVASIQLVEKMGFEYSGDLDDAMGGPERIYSLDLLKFREETR